MMGVVLDLGPFKPYHANQINPKTCIATMGESLTLLSYFLAFINPALGTALVFAMTFSKRIFLVSYLTETKSLQYALAGILPFISSLQLWSTSMTSVFCSNPNVSFYIGAAFGTLLAIIAVFIYLFIHGARERSAAERAAAEISPTTGQNGQGEGSRGEMAASSQ